MSGYKSNGPVPLEPTLQPTLPLWGWLAELGIGNKNSEKKTCKKIRIGFISMTGCSESQFLPGSASQSDMGSGCFSPRLDGKLPGQAINPLPTSCFRLRLAILINQQVWSSVPTHPEGGHGGRVVTLSPPTSAAGVRSPSWP